MYVTCEQVTAKSKEELIRFLLKNEEYSLFLLSNLKTYGLELSAGLYSGNFKLLREGKQIVAAFCLTKTGALIVQSIKQDLAICEAMIAACSEEKMSIRGVMGEWEFASILWNLLKQKRVIEKESFTEREILYTFDIETTAYASEPDARLLVASDVDAWIQLRMAYTKEMGLPGNSLEETRTEFLMKATQSITWGLFFEGKLVAIADLNAQFSDIGQLGGVYTIPAYRKKGFSTRLICHLIHDLKTIHRLRKLVIFTGERNYAARRVYESMRIAPFGYYALLFS
jgi:predicted GNAT family acetyltransferase